MSDHPFDCNCLAVCLLCNTAEMSLGEMNQHVAALHKPEQIESVELRNLLVRYTPRVALCVEAQAQAYG